MAMMCNDLANLGLVDRNKCCVRCHGDENQYGLMRCSLRQVVGKVEEGQVVEVCCRAVEQLTFHEHVKERFW